MSCLSRVTINQREIGALVDLGAVKLIELLDLVGIKPGWGKYKGHKPHFDQSAQR